MAESLLPRGGTLSFPKWAFKAPRPLPPAVVHLSHTGRQAGKQAPPPLIKITAAAEPSPTRTLQPCKGAKKSPEQLSPADWDLPEGRQRGVGRGWEHRGRVGGKRAASFQGCKRPSEGRHICPSERYPTGPAIRRSICVYATCVWWAPGNHENLCVSYWWSTVIGAVSQLKFIFLSLLQTFLNLDPNTGVFFSLES